LLSSIDDVFDMQKNSRYDGQIAVFGSEFQQKLADVSYFLVSMLHTGCLVLALVVVVAIVK